jgi:hypothetical protein
MNWVCTPTEIRSYDQNCISGVRGELGLLLRSDSVPSQPQLSAPKPKSVKGHVTHPTQPSSIRDIEDVNFSHLYCG